MRYRRMWRACSTRSAAERVTAGRGPLPRVNDHYGYATGDDHLRAIAQVLRKTVIRPTDLAARHGGE